MHAITIVPWICVWASAPSPGRREDCFVPNLNQDILRVPSDDCQHFSLASLFFIRSLVTLFSYHLQLSSSYFIFPGSLDVLTLLLRLRLLPSLGLFASIAYSTPNTHNFAFFVCYHVSYGFCSTYGLTPTCWPTFHFLLCWPLECALEKCLSGVEFS
jgi:hypothetical protein